MKPDCFKCKHKRTIPGNAHIRCGHPMVDSNDPLSNLASLFGGGTPHQVAMEKMGVTGHETGIKNGWFMWPFNFDPNWLLSCNGMEEVLQDGK